MGPSARSGTQAPRTLEEEETARYYEKYYAGHGVGGRERLKALMLVKDLVASGFGAYQEVLAVHAEGSLEAEKMMVLRSYDPLPATAYVRRLAGLTAPAPVPSDASVGAANI